MWFIMIRILATFFAACVFFAQFVAADELRPLRIGLNNSPPLAFSPEDGTPDGILVRQTRTLLGRTGLRGEIGVYPAPRLFRDLQEGLIDMSMLVHAPSLDSCCLLSSQPIMTHVLRIYWLREVPPVRSAEEIVNKSVILLHGYSYAGLTKLIQDEKAGNRVEFAKSFEAAFQMLERGRADYLLAYDANATDLLASRNIAELHSSTIARYPVHIVINRRHPDATALLKRFEKAMSDSAQVKQ